MNSFKRIHPHAITIWQIRLILGTFFPAFLLFFFFYPQNLLWKCIAGFCIGVFVFFSLLWFPIKYWKLAYRVEGETFYLRQGVIYTNYCAVSRGQLQYITLTTTPLQRYFSLCSVVLVMAGANLFLPCIPREEGDALCRWGERRSSGKEEP